MALAPLRPDQLAAENGGGRIHRDFLRWLGVLRDAVLGLDRRDTAPPTGGTWTVGQRIWNSAPAAGQPVGWVCTADGTPGTWRPFGAVT